jgi:hypothetical protein
VGNHGGDKLRAEYEPVLALTRWGTKTGGSSIQVVAAIAHQWMPSWLHGQQSRVGGHYRLVDEATAFELSGPRANVAHLSSLSVAFPRASLREVFRNCATASVPLRAAVKPRVGAERRGSVESEVALLERRTCGRSRESRVERFDSMLDVASTKSPSATATLPLANGS